MIAGPEGGPSSDMQHGTRVFSRLAGKEPREPVQTSGAGSRVLGSPANILSLTRQPEIRTHISGASPNTALLRLSGQHGAATGAIR
jgi:hypothetical protein